MFHKHKYNLTEKRTLWCECGDTKVLPCEHFFKHDCDIETTNIFTKNKRVTGRLMVCEKCGEPRQVSILDR